jgi:hypothetical protein
MTKLTVAFRDFVNAPKTVHTETFLKWRLYAEHFQATSFLQEEIKFGSVFITKQ